MNLNEGLLSIRVPGPAVTSHETDDSLVGKVLTTLHTVSLSDGAGVTVSITEIPAVALDFAGHDTIYDNARGALLKKTFGRTDSFSDVDKSGFSGKSLHYTTPPHAGHSGFTGQAELFLVNHTLVVINTLVPRGKDATLAETVFSSLTLAGR